ncbi:ESX secretion-associated protein EspG [Nocardia takedensis]
MSSWSFTDLEFKVLCDLRREGELPVPFVWTSDIPGLDEYERQWREVSAELTYRIDSALEALLDAFTHPDVVVGAQVWSDTDFDNPDKRIRVHAGTRGSRAYLIEQLPGRTVQHAGGFTIRPVQPRGIGEAIAALLPTAPAGKRGPVVIDLDEPRPTDSFGFGSGSLIADEDEVGFSSKRFFDIDAVSTGSVQVVQGRSKYGPRGINRAGRVWRDLAGDGRYVMPLHHPAPEAVGMSSVAMTDWIDGEIASILERMDTFEEVDQ